jgi:hypothetical protein
MPPRRAADEKDRITSKKNNVRIKKDRRGEVEKSEVKGKCKMRSKFRKIEEESSAECP